MADSEWEASVTSVQQTFRRSSVGMRPVGLAEVCRVGKRLSLYIGLCRRNCTLIAANPKIIDPIPNPCDNAISKRTWELAIFQCRQELRTAETIDASDFLDAQGGSHNEDQRLAICSAINAHAVASCQISFSAVASASLVDVVRTVVSKECALPYFGINVVVDMACVDDDASWVDCGRPDPIFIVKKPFTLSFTQDLFDAVENREDDHVRQFLCEGQGPNCVCQQTALMHAVVKQNPAAVSMLLQGGAVDFIPSGQLQGALRAAAIQPDPSILEVPS